MRDLATPTATKVLGAVGLVAVAGLGWVLGIGPETAKLSETRAEVTSVQEQNDVLTTQLAGLVKQQQELGATRHTATQLARRFPATADQPGLFEAVTTAAVDAGIGADGLTTLAPTPPIVGAADGTAPAPAPAGSTTPTGTTAAPGQLARQTVTVTVTGTYDQTQQLLVNLEHMHRAYLVSSVALAGDTEGGAYTTTITGEMFVMSPVPDPGRTVDVASTTSNATDPKG